jgi:hypothetical protein
VGEQHVLAAHREVAPLREALVVLGHQDPAQVRVVVEDHPEHVVDLALLVVRCRPGLGDTRHVRCVEGHADLDRHAVDLVHVEELVVHAEPRLLGEVVDAVDGGQEVEALTAQVLERPADRGRGDRQRGLVAEVDGVEHGLRVALAQFLGDQLQARRVRHPEPRSPARTP